MAQDAWLDDPVASHTKSQKSTQNTCYWLQNDTGVAITYWLVGVSRNWGSEESGARGWQRCGPRSGTIVQPDSSVALSVPGNREEFKCHPQSSGCTRWVGTDKMFEGALQHNMICIQLEGTQTPSPPMSIDLVGLQSFEVKFSESKSKDGENQKLYYEQGLVHDCDPNALEMGHTLFCSQVVFEVTIQEYSKLVHLCSTVRSLNLPVICFSS